MEKTISVNLRIWRQRGPRTKGQFQNYHLDGVSTGATHCLIREDGGYSHDDFFSI